MGFWSSILFARIAQPQTKSANTKTFSATTDTDACSVFDYFRAVGFCVFHLVWQSSTTASNGKPFSV